MARIKDFKKGDKVRIKFSQNPDGIRFLNLLYRNSTPAERGDAMVIETTIAMGFDREDEWTFILLEDGAEFDGLDRRGAVTVTRV